MLATPPGRLRRHSLAVWSASVVWSKLHANPHAFVDEQFVVLKWQNSRKKPLGQNIITASVCDFVLRYAGYHEAHFWLFSTLANNRNVEFRVLKKFDFARADSCDRIAMFRFTEAMQCVHHVCQILSEQNRRTSVDMALQIAEGQTVKMSPHKMPCNVRDHDSRVPPVGQRLNCRRQ